jgi:hypothetical protein
MPRALRQLAFYAGALGVVATPMVGCALSLKLSMAECTVVPDNTRVSMSSIVRFTDFNTAFGVSGALAVFALLDALLDYDASPTGRVTCIASSILMLAPFVVPISDGQSYYSGDANTSTDWAHIGGAGGGALLLLLYVYQLMARESNIALMSIFSTLMLSGGLAFTAVLMDSLGALGEARQLVLYGVLWGEFGAIGGVLGLFNYITRERGRKQIKLLNV